MTEADAVAESWRAPEEARRYRALHEGGLLRRLRTHLERRFLERALRRLGPIESILDVPSGAGRFSPILAAAARTVVSADASAAMLRARPAIGQAVLARAERLPFCDGAFDVVVCHRLVHHLGDAADRARVFAELARVARRAVVFSYWTAASRRGRRLPGLRTRGLAKSVARRHFLAPAALARELSPHGLVALRTDHKLRWFSPVALVTCRCGAGAKAVARVGE